MCLINCRMCTAFFFPICYRVRQLSVVYIILMLLVSFTFFLKYKHQICFGSINDHDLDIRFCITFEPYLMKHDSNSGLSVK